MALWQIGLILLGLVWALQAVGTWVQMRHYREVMGRISGQWSDGFLGAGTARAKLGRGVILLVVVGPDGTVRRVAAMQGRSVFARFTVLPEFEGLGLEALRRGEGAGAGRSKGFDKALAQAIDQIDRTRARSAVETPAA